jgi:hypothetical protein
VLARIAEGETLTAMVRSYNVSHMTISRPAAVTFMQLDHAIFGSVTELSGFGVWARYPGRVRKTHFCPNGFEVPMSSVGSFSFWHSKKLLPKPLPLSVGPPWSALT